ncbi:MAG: M48 family metalloprotease [Betaproteobacteria bacterium]|nr:M48 family metalloprotease [Betaproteobacteria bacterium]
MLFAQIIVQGAISVYSLYILEATTTKSVHIIHIGLLGLVFAAGAFKMISAGLSIPHRAGTRVIGRLMSREEQPRLWEFVTGLAQRLGAQAPWQVVIGLAPNFYVTSADVTVVPGPTTHRDETLYLSLPLMRILSRDELAAVVGHELGHFRGEDTKFSLKFYPIYAGTAQALAALQDASAQGRRVAWPLRPAFAVLTLLLEEFAKAERSIGREREFAADQAGASVASPRAIATSLLKLEAFAGLWPGIRSAMINALNQGKAYSNVSALYAAAAAASARREPVDEVAKLAIFHPTDSHPPTQERVQALGLSVSALHDEALQIDPNACSALLLENVSELEELLTKIEHRVLLECGYAKLPGAAPVPFPVPLGGKDKAMKAVTAHAPQNPVDRLCGECWAPIAAGAGLEVAGRLLPVCDICAIKFTRKRWQLWKNAS